MHSEAQWRLRQMRRASSFVSRTVQKGLLCVRPALRRIALSINRRSVTDLKISQSFFLFQKAVEDLIFESERVTGVKTQIGIRFHARSVILTAGTFLNGKIHVGANHHTGGRAGEPAALSLSARLKALGIAQGRLKTGTPPRIDGRTIHFSRLLKQEGDVDPIPVFSFIGREDQHPAQLPCWITCTNARTHDIIRGGLDRSPIYSGSIEGVGPRYCPSVE